MLCPVCQSWHPKDHTLQPVFRTAGAISLSSGRKSYAGSLDGAPDYEDSERSDSMSPEDAAREGQPQDDGWEDDAQHYGSDGEDWAAVLSRDSRAPRAMTGDGQRRPRETAITVHVRHYSPIENKVGYPLSMVDAELKPAV